MFFLQSDLYISLEISCDAPRPAGLPASSLDVLGYYVEHVKPCMASCVTSRFWNWTQAIAEQVFERKHLKR